METFQKFCNLINLNLRIINLRELVKDEDFFKSICLSLDLVTDSV